VRSRRWKFVKRCLHNLVWHWTQLNAVHVQSNFLRTQSKLFPFPLYPHWVIKFSFLDPAFTDEDSFEGGEKGWRGNGNEIQGFFGWEIQLTELVSLLSTCHEDFTHCWLYLSFFDPPQILSHPPVSKWFSAQEILRLCSSVWYFDVHAQPHATPSCRHPEYLEELEKTKLYQQTRGGESTDWGTLCRRSIINPHFHLTSTLPHARRKKNRICV